MGSRTPEGHHHPSHGLDADSKPAAIVAKPSNGTGPGDDEVGGGTDDDDDDDDELHGNDETPGVSNEAVNTEKKKKKRKKSKKKKKNSNGNAAETGDGNGNGNAAGELKQTSPPTVPLSLLFPGDTYPEGEHHSYDVNHTTARTTGEELRHLSRVHNMDDEFLREYRKAAETHRQVRSWVHSVAKPGASLSMLAEGIESGVRALTGHDGLSPGDSLEAGMGFPTGLCVNHIAAHWTPSPGGKEVFLQERDVLSVDFGVHVKGRIVDSAFTLAWDPLYDPLLESVRAATETGVKHAGPDARMADIGAAIQEVMESYEVTLHDGKTYPVKAVRSISGHDILRYRIHGGKQVPFVRSHSRQRMEEGEIFAIETFGSTGLGRTHDDVGIYGYGINYDLADRTPGRVAAAVAGNLRMQSAKNLIKTIEQQFGTIVWCRRYLERLGVERYLAGLNHLVAQGVVEEYCPLSDVKGSYVAQFEHTILLKEGGKEIVSRGDDY